MNDYLLVHIICPEASHRFVKRVLGQQIFAVRRRPSFVNVLDDDTRLRKRLTIMDEHGDLLMDRVRIEEELTFDTVFLGNVLVGDIFEDKGELDSDAEGARPETDELDGLCSHGRIEDMKCSKR